LIVTENGAPALQLLILLELNEVNFEHVLDFASRGELPHLSRLIREHGLAETRSETAYDELEPWIQWVTAHTGLPFKDHRVFRLGDIVNHDFEQIWEHLERNGLRVGAISPINAKNRVHRPAFFVPDPWTPTTVSAGRLLTGVYRAVSQAVNDNAEGRLTPSAVAWLMAGAARYANARNYPRYARMLAAVNRPWMRPMVLDLLLADIFTTETRKTRPNFASLFLNGAAHIQHHYMFNSSAYRGERRNPEWYIEPHRDPVMEVYRLYDGIVGQLREQFPAARLMIATGLHQVPHAEVTFYWRLKEHAHFLRRLGLEFVRVETRMSRDFIVGCRSPESAAAAERLLRAVKHVSGVPLFQVDNRGLDLFVMLTWPHDIETTFIYEIGGRRVHGFKDDVAFVAIKNGEHNGVGYFIDTGSSGVANEAFPLAQLPARVCEALNVAELAPRAGTSEPAHRVG
jgi:hypothetical protein